MKNFEFKRTPVPVQYWAPKPIAKSIAGGTFVRLSAFGMVHFVDRESQGRIDAVPPKYYSVDRATAEKHLPKDLHL